MVFSSRKTIVIKLVGPFLITLLLGCHCLFAQPISLPDGQLLAISSGFTFIADSARTYTVTDVARPGMLNQLNPDTTK